jgi:transposase
MGRPCYLLNMEKVVREEIEQRFLKTKDVRERERLEVLRLAASGHYTLTEMAGEVGRARSVVHGWLNKFKREGLAAMLARRKPGASTSALHEPALMAALLAELRAGNFRTAVQMQRWLKDRHGIEMTIWGAYYWLKKLEARLKVPRPVHLKKDPLAAEKFPVELEAKLRALPLEPGRPVRIWVQDEGRFGLHTIVRRCWGLSGVRIVKTNQKKYQWGYIYGALEIGTGKTESLFMPGVGLEVSEVFLRHLAESEPKAEHIVIWDGAGFHQKAGKHALPDRVHVIQLPAYSPELNPIEKLWDVLKDGICNRMFHTLEELWQALVEELKPFYEPQRVFQLLGTSSLLASANVSSRQ